MPRATGLSPSLKTVAAAARAWSISLRLRERAEWHVTSASVCRSWSLRLDGIGYRIEAHVSAFLESPRDPGFVFSLMIRCAGSRRPVREDLVQTSWFLGLHARLGAAYALEDMRGDVRLVRALRGTTEPSRALRELRHVSAAVEGKTSRRIADEEQRAVKPAQEQREDLWTILDSLHEGRWRVSSVHHSLRRQVRDDGSRWNVYASFIVMVDSAEGPPGFAGTVGAWSKRAERLKRGSRITKALALLPPVGYRRLAEIHYNRWHRGLGFPAADREIELLERVMHLMVRATQ